MAQMALGLTVAVIAAALLLESASAARALQGLNGTGDKKSWMEVLDADARIYLHHHFLSDEECDTIREKALKRLARSGVVAGAGGGKTEENSIRTSDGMFFARGEDEMIERIERRLADWTLTPIHNGEGLQVLRYKMNQKYGAASEGGGTRDDNLMGGTVEEIDAPGGNRIGDRKNGENRYATVLMYLEAAEEGGETVFPKVPSPHGVNVGFSDCAKTHLAGEKWSMTKWIHASHYTMGDKYDRAAKEVAEKLAEHQKLHDSVHAPAADL
eukprot:gene26442-17539_t